MAFPSTAKAKVWIGKEDTVRNALRLYRPHSWRGRLVAEIFRAAPEMLARTVLQNNGAPVPNERFDLLARTVLDAMNERRATVSFYVGTAGPHRKVTAQISRGHEVIAYVKIASSAVACSLLANESLVLSRLPAMRSAEVPRVIRTLRMGGHTFLFLTAPRKAGGYSPTLPDEHDTLFLEELGRLESGRELAASALAALLPSGIRSDLLDRVRDVVMRLLSHSGVPTGLVHGDYAPWNSLRLEKRRLYVFDWEYAESASPVLHDAFHRILMPRRLLSRDPPAKIVRRLLTPGLYPLLDHAMAVYRIAIQELPGHLLLYLLWLGKREQTANGELTPYLAQCLEEALSSAAT